MRKPVPFFLERTPWDGFAMWATVVSNGLVIIGGLAYLVFNAEGSGFPWLALPVALALGLLLGDFATGAVHWAVDTWFDEEFLGRVVLIAREHHSHPHHILGYGFLEHSALGSGPSAAVLVPVMSATALLGGGAWSYGAMIVSTITAACLFFGTSFHNLGHRPARSRITRRLQGLGLLITPGYHAVHHRQPQMVRYCVVTGWANPICDRFGVWRLFERMVTGLTGIEPRTDDIVWRSGWQRRVARAGSGNT
jgi:hypothetical protein